MSSESDAEAAISRLYEDEALTGDLDDAPARALLKWGAERLKASRPEDAVRQAMHVLVQMVRDRGSLTPADVRAKLVAAGLTAPAEADIAALWAETALPAGEWAEKLAAMAGGMASRPSPQLTSQPPSSPPDSGGGQWGKGVEERPPVPWWQRIFRRRRP